MREVFSFVVGGITAIVAFAGFVVLLPVQLASWLAVRRPWGNTEPYQALNYLLYWGLTDPGEIARPYAEWKLDKFAPPRYHDGRELLDEEDFESDSDDSDDGS